MTGKVVNLRTARKARARDDKRAQGDAQAAKHGRAKSERDATEAAAAKTRRDLDAHRRE